MYRSEGSVSIGSGRDGYILASSVILVFVAISALLISLSYVNLISSVNRDVDQAHSAHYAAASGIAAAVSCIENGHALPSTLTPSSACVGMPGTSLAGNAKSSSTFSTTNSGTDHFKTLTSTGRDDLGAIQRTYNMKADIALSSDSIVTSISTNRNCPGTLTNDNCLHTLIVSSSGELYSYGANRPESAAVKYKTLGRIVNNDNAVIKKVPQSYFNNEKLISAHATPVNSYVVSESGAVWAWGRNNAGQLGIGSKYGNHGHEPLPVRIDPSIFNNEKVIKILGSQGTDIGSLTTSRVIALTEEGSAYGWGSNSWYSGGYAAPYNPLFFQVVDPENDAIARQQHILSPFKFPAILFDNMKVVDVSIGHHSLVLTEDGSVWGWGSDLGMSDDFSQYFKQLRAQKLDPSYFNNKPVVDISTLRTNTIVLNSDGEVFTWGLDQDHYDIFSEYEDGVPIAHSPARFQSKKIVDVGVYGGDGACFMAIAEDGDIFMWGYNRDGDLGLGFAGSDTILYGPLAAVRYPQKINLSSVGGVGEVRYIADNFIATKDSIYSWGGSLPGSSVNFTTSYSPVDITPSNFSSGSTSNLDIDRVYIY